jgi:hypothetical protein
MFSPQFSKIHNERDPSCGEIEFHYSGWKMTMKCKCRSISGKYRQVAPYRN